PALRASPRGDCLACPLRDRPAAGVFRILGPPPHRRARNLPRSAPRPPVGRLGHLFASFEGPYLWTTVKVTLMVAGAQGGGYALGIWMPTYLRTVRGLSATGTGGFLLVQILGALCGFLLGSYLSDAIGRKWTFMLSAIGSLVMILIYMFVPMDNTALLFV